MRSPAVAFSLLAAATAVSVSASGLQSTPVIDPNTLSPKLDKVDLNSSGLGRAHRRNVGAGLGISDLSSGSPSHFKRAHIGHSRNSDNIDSRPGELTHSMPRPEPPQHAESGAIGCNDPDAVTGESATVAHGTAFPSTSVGHL